MNESTKTKKALRGSLFALFLCIVLLIGTTFAWFTDTASTGVNKIQAGNLDVDLQVKEGNDWVSAEGKTLDFVKAADAAEGEEILWEPGCKYKLPEIRVVNNGNLALKYKLKVTGIQGDAKLNEVIDWTYKIDNNDYELDKEHSLAAGENSGAMTIQGHMQESAGNEYQGLTIKGVGITVVATQDTVESDSFNHTYDKDAAYKGTHEFTSGTHTLSKGGVGLKANDSAVNASGSDTNVTITGGFYDGGSGGNNKCVYVHDGATVTIEDGTFTVGGDANKDGNSVVYCVGGNVVIKGGFFYTDYAWRNFYYVLNQNNGKPGTITVTGGTFVNYDPSTGDDNLSGNFVPTGYHVEKSTHGSDTWYTVVAD